MVPEETGRVSFFLAHSSEPSAAITAMIARTVFKVFILLFYPEYVDTAMPESGAAMKPTIRVPLFGHRIMR